MTDELNTVAQRDSQLNEKSLFSDARSCLSLDKRGSLMMAEASPRLQSQSKVYVKLNQYLSIPRNSVVSNVKRRKDRFLLNDLISDPYRENAFQGVLMRKNNSMTHAFSSPRSRQMRRNPTADNTIDQNISSHVRRMTTFQDPNIVVFNDKSSQDLNDHNNIQLESQRFPSVYEI